MAEGLLRARYGDRFDVESAGTQPGSVHPLAVVTMREMGIDIAGQTSKHIDEVVAARTFDVVVTVCDLAREACPFVPANDRQLQRSSPILPQPPARATNA